MATSLRSYLEVFKRFVKKYGRQILAIAAAIYTGGVLTAGWSAWASGAAAGFVGGAISTGSLKGAIRGAVFGGISAQFAHAIGHGGANNSALFKGSFEKAVAHGSKSRCG